MRYYFNKLFIQPEPQLKSSLCSSVISSHNSRDVILSHNSRNITCLTPILSHNSRDMFRATTHGTPTSQPSRYHQSLVNHAHPKQAKHRPDLYIIACTTPKPPGETHF